MSMTAADVVTAMRRRYKCETDESIGPEWAVLSEVDVAPGWPDNPIDLLFIRAWRGKRGHERHAVEVKVSRADLRREVDTPSKWQGWWSRTHRFYLAVPSSLNLDGIELPEEWGVIEVRDTGATRQVREALHRNDPAPMPETFAVEAFRRAGRAEARIRGADTADPAARIAELEREVAAYARSLDTARRAEARWRQRSDSCMRTLAHASPAPVCHCGTPLQPTRKGSTRWLHDGEPGDTGYGPCAFPSIDVDQLAESVLGEEATT